MPSSSRSRHVADFPFVKPGDPAGVALVAAVRRLSSSRSLGEVMEVTTLAARALLGADGISFVLREGDQCHYAEEA